MNEILREVRNNTSLVLVEFSKSSIDPCNNTDSYYMEAYSLIEKGIYSYLRSRAAVFRTAGQVTIEGRYNSVLWAWI